MVKSAALPDLARGGECRHIRRRANYLVCKGPSGIEYWLPLVRKFNYLSMTMVHKQPESATLCRRIVAAKHAFQKLRPVLHARVQNALVAFAA